MCRVCPLQWRSLFPNISSNFRSVRSRISTRISAQARCELTRRKARGYEKQDQEARTTGNTKHTDRNQKWTFAVRVKRAALAHTIPNRRQIIYRLAQQSASARLSGSSHTLTLLTREGLPLTPDTCTFEVSRVIQDLLKGLGTRTRLSSHVFSVMLAPSKPCYQSWWSSCRG